MAEEIGFLKYLDDAKVPMNEYKVSWKKVSKVQMEVRATFALFALFIRTVIGSRISLDLFAEMTFNFYEFV